MAHYALLFTLIVLSLTACGGQPDVPPTEPDGDAPTGSIQWPRTAEHVIFRIETRGGQDAEAFYRQNEVPICSIYGDGRVVWLDDSEQVLWDRLTDEEIHDFATTLIGADRIYNYTSERDQALPNSQSPVVEVITLDVNNTPFETDAFADWEPAFYESVLARCRSAGDSPEPLMPDAAWLSAILVPYEPNSPVIYWDAEAAGLRINDLAASGERQWVEGRSVTAMWAALRDVGINAQFEEARTAYKVAVQVPGVTIGAPPAPGAAQAE